VIRIIRAFAWLRWRVLVNSLERTGARDAVERLSIAVENLGPMIALVLLIPSTLGMGVLAAAAGFGLATGAWTVPFEVLRYLLLAALVFAVLGPIVLPSRDAGNPVRFLLLPVPRALLYVAHLAAAIADPWVLLAAAALIGVPVGLAIGGRLVAALVSLLAGAGFFIVLTGITSLTSSVIHLLLRNRRRGDLVMLLLVLIVPLVGLWPSLLRADRLGARHGHGGPAVQARPAGPTAIDRATLRVAAYIPSELYRQAARAAVERVPAAGLPLGFLLLTAAAIQALGFGAFGRMLDMPATLGARHAGSLGGLWGRTIPGLSAGGSAVALTQLRLALRTTRGRSILASPLIILGAFGTVLHRRGGLPFGHLSVNDGLTLAVFACFIAMFAVLPIAANQFAIDRAGFTRQMLSPLSLGDLLVGKAVGNLLICAGPALCCFIIAAAVFPGGDLALWIAVVPAWIATYALVAPVVAALSAVFPRSVNLSSIGSGSNAHPAAAVLGLLTFLLASAPSALLVLLAARWMHRPGLAPAFTLAWCVIALALSRILFVPLQRLLASRCETLAQYS